jgi:tetratricopeptide (TPR) repeat protein
MIVYDRALRFKTADTYLDQVFWDAQRVIAKSKEPFFREFVGDGKVSREERAQMLYRVCFSSFLCGHESEAHDLAENILASLQPEGVTKAQCLYMRAHLLGRAGKWDGAAAEWKTLIDMSPKREILAGAYLEYARALDLADDRLGAALALEELSVRLPARRETAQAGALVEQLLLREPQLRPEVAEQKPLIAAKWREQEKWRPADEDEEPAGIAGGIVPPVRIATKGGAE